MSTDTADIGLDADQLKHISQHLQSRYIQPKKIAGCLTLVARGGKIGYLQAEGYADLERQQPMREDSIFRIYSMSKPIAAVALLKLYERGHFQLGDPVSRFIPNWKNLRVYKGGVGPFLTEACQRQMTIRDLFTHTSGLTYGFLAQTNVDRAYRKGKIDLGGPDRNLQSMVDTLAELPLEFSPGSAWNYSVASDVLGHLVEVISGLPFDVFLQQEIFNPLGMVDTGFFVPEEKLPRFTANYNRGPDKKLRIEDDPLASSYAKMPSYLSGGGGLVSTASDYFRFCQMLCNGGTLDGVKVLGRKTIELMTLNHLPNNQDLTTMARAGFSETAYDGVGFGLGVAVTKNLADAQITGSVGEYYWGGAASTIFWIDPKEDLVVIYLTQFMPSGQFNFRGQLKSIIYPALS